MQEHYINQCPTASTGDFVAAIAELWRPKPIASTVLPSNAARLALLLVPGRWDGLFKLVVILEYLADAVYARGVSRAKQPQCLHLQS